jgi:secreted Zn-dependent insulinase-like peptidase
MGNTFLALKEMSVIRLQFLRYVCSFFILFIVVGISTSDATDNENIESQIQKGSIDDRQYQYFVLNNKLKVLLISDEDADKAAASMDVNVGSIHDPVDREGLAHFLEHMLFLGTKKFPEADAYQAFISDNGGSHNAYTSSHHTNYYFDVDHKKLDDALDRFSQFFVAPLFDETYVDRERNAVHSEYQASLRDDFRRSFDVYRNVINQAHPEAKFSVGSLMTLADRANDNVRDDLLSFYKQHYSASKMSLVVLGRQSLAELKTMVVDRFSQVPLSIDKTHSDPDKTALQPLFMPGQLPMEVLSKPVKELRQMSMKFPLPSIKQYYQEKPLDFIGYLLGHEGKGSLLSILKAEGLAENLSAGGSDKNDGTAAFYISMRLTAAGVQQREKIRALVFYALEQIKKDGVEEWRYEEKRLLAQTAFQFREKSSAIFTVRSLASNLHQYPAAEVISGDYLLNNYDAKLIKRFLSKLTPSNVLVTSVYPEVETNKVTLHYKVAYSQQKLSSDLPKLDKSLTADFSLPTKNPFIPENINLFAVDPTLQSFTRLQAGNINLWAKQDLDYKTPKVKVFFRVMSPQIAGNIKGSVLASLYTDLIRDRLNEYTYSALLADTAISIRENDRGIDIVLEGYHDKLYALMDLFLDEVDGENITFERFIQLRSDLLRRLRNSDKGKPYHQLYKQLVINVTDSDFTDIEKITELENITLDDITVFAKQWRVDSRIQGLYYGNFDQVWLNQWQAYAKRLQQQKTLAVKNAYGSIKNMIAPIKVMRIDSDMLQYHVRNVDHNDQAAILYVQSPSDTVSDQAKMSVLRQMMQSPFYSSLRTEQQLGYIVFMGSLRLKEVPASVFVVQSPTASVDDIQKAVTQFITDFSNNIPVDVEVFKRAVITKLLEAAPSLSASANIYWSDITQSDGRVNRRQRLIDAVEKVTSDDIKQFYQQVMLSPKHALWQYSREPNFNSEQTLYKKGPQFYGFP